MSAGNITPFSLNEQFHAPFDFLDTTELNARAGMRFMVIKRRHAGFQRDEPETTGYFEGAHYLRDINRSIRKGLGAVRWSTPVLLDIPDKAPGDPEPPPVLLPIRRPDGDPDPRREGVGLNNLNANFTVCGVPGPGTVTRTPGTKTPVTTPSKAGNIAAELPGGWAGILLRTTEELSQELTWLPAWLNVTIANHRGRTRPEFSTRLADIDGRGIDQHRIAGFDSAFRVEECWDIKPPGNSGDCAVSLFWGAFAKRPDIGRGLFSESGRFFGGVTPDAVVTVGYASSSGGGPITAGAVKDKHFVGNAKDGYPINQGHLDLDAPWFKDATRDAPPLVDDEIYKLARPARGIPWEVFLRYDPEKPHPIAGVRFSGGNALGRFRWQTAMPFFLPPDPPPPEDEPPPVPPQPPKVPDGIIPNPFDPTGPLAGGAVVDPLTGPTGGGVSEAIGATPGAPRRAQPPGRQRLNTPNKKCIYSLLHFWQEQGAGAIALRPRHSRGKDYRYDPAPDPDELAEQIKTTPIIGRFEVIGNETGMGWARTVEDGCIGRYRAGHANGGAWYMPPELDPDILTRPGGIMPATLSDFFIGLWRANLFFGSPDVDFGGTPNGKGKNGFQLGINAPAAPATPDRLEFTHDIEGARTEAAHLTDTGIGRFAGATSAPQERRRIQNGSGLLVIPAAGVVKVTAFDAVSGLARAFSVTATGDTAIGIAAANIAPGAAGDVIVSGAMDGSGIPGIGAAAVGDAVYFSAVGALTLAAGSASVGFVLDPAAGMIWVAI